MIFARLRLWLAAAGAAVVAVVLAYFRGKKAAGDEYDEVQNEAYRETREAIDDAEIHGNDPDAARRWLQHRADNQR